MTCWWQREMMGFARRSTQPTRAYSWSTLRIASLVTILCACTVHADALEFQLSEFSLVSRPTIEAMVPKLAEAYPNARFLVSGFSSPSGEWRFVRVEDDQACQADLCPTVVIHEKVEWKVLVIAKKEIGITINTVNGNSISCNIKSKDGLEIVIRYVDDDKILFITK